MKKYITFMFAVITAHVHSMEMNLWRLPVDTLDLIAQDFSFRDVETEKEFITRTEKLHNTALKDTIQLPLTYAQLPFTNIKFVAYCPNNAIIAILEDKSKGKGENFCRYAPLPKLVIIDRKNNQSQVHNFGNKWDTKYSSLAVSRDGNMVATIHSEFDDSRMNHECEVLIYKNVLTITNLSTNITVQHDVGDRTTLAFNKQGTNIILHQSYPHNPYRIIPVTINNPTTTNDTNIAAQPQKTLAKYFAQKRICKDLLGQLQEQKSNFRKASKQLLAINNQ